MAEVIQALLGPSQRLMKPVRGFLGAVSIPPIFVNDHRDPTSPVSIPERLVKAEGGSASAVSTPQSLPSKAFVGH